MRTLVLIGAALLTISNSRSWAGSPSGSPGRPRVVLDCCFNNEWKTDASGARWRYHYVWSDTLDSGFSQLETIVRDCGADPDTLCQVPTDQALSTAAVYLIVDPDTPKETAHPTFIDDSASAVIARWVSHGGILLLLGNDSGNAEFAHLNRLASRFGIRFNEDSRNKVVGKDYTTGTFSALPPHPMFEGVRKIFLKEISTLALHKPAEPILVDGGDVIVAMARVGSGLVVAVGDPWFYNEYMDHRRLPEEYDNALVARNLFRWLLAFHRGEVH